MLGVYRLRVGRRINPRLNLEGPLEESSATLEISKSLQGSPIRITVLLRNVKEPALGKVYTIWAVAPDGVFMKLGGFQAAGQIYLEAPLKEFGLLLTLEDRPNALEPSGPRIGFAEPLK